MATIDGWGRFAELSFEKNNRIKIKPLIKFPGASLDEELITWPGANLLYAQAAGKMVFLADVGTGKRKAFAPLLSWVHYDVYPALLDPQEGLFLFVYRDMDEVSIHRTILYNYKTDTVVQEEDLDLYMEYSIGGEWLFARTILNDRETYEGRTGLKEMFLYNWKTKEIRRNKLTRTFTALNMYEVNFENEHSLSLQKRYIIGPSKQMRKTVKLSWSEDYEDVTVLPLDYLLPQGKSFSRFFLSYDGEWATTYVGSYRGLNNEALEKRVFLHMDSRYPGGISMPVYCEGYEEYDTDYGTFVKHPEYGMCYCREVEKNGKRYLRLYKMSDVLQEIEGRNENTE
ncbi:hypothetical protein FACS1894110_24220 [Spirochaetia bacterium]|nr:hypothetical protein FACS1894110_24220 [Spirochaetia bacterium]